MRDPEFVTAFEAELATRHEISSVFKNDLLILSGSKILDLMDPSKCAIPQEEAGDNEETAQDQIIQSQLLSGGLPMHMYAYFSSEKLSEIEQDAGVIADKNAEVIDKIKEARNAQQNRSTDGEKTAIFSGLMT